MASEDVAQEEKKTNVHGDSNDVVSIDLPAPQGWKKMFIPRKSGTPQRNYIVFISPSGEEINNKKQLSQYFKSHPGGPSASEFDWGTGDTPRRSTRLSEKLKTVETPESEPPKKTQKKSNSKKGSEGKKGDTDGEGVAVEDKAGEGKTQTTTEVEMESVEDVSDHNKGDRDPVTGSDQNSEQKTNEIIMEKLQNKEASNINTDAKEEQDKNGLPPITLLEEIKEETEKQMAEPKIQADKQPAEPKNDVDQQRMEPKSEAKKQPEKHEEQAVKQPTEPEIPPPLPAFPETASSEKVKLSEETEEKRGKEPEETDEGENVLSNKETCAEKVT